MKLVRLASSACALGALTAGPAPALAFVDWSNDTGDVTVAIRGSAIWALHAARSLRSDDPYAAEIGTADLRAIGEADLGPHVRLEVHAREIVAGSGAPVLRSFAGPSGAAGPADRSAALHWTQRSGDRAGASLSVDRLAARISFEPLDITIGRQPVNLATTLLFTPNDLFAPFSASTFFRVYKPGVDAARADLELGTLTSVSVLGVLGYEEPTGADPAPRAPDLDRSSLLAFGRNVIGDVEVGWLAGELRDEGFVFGGSLQFELFDWLGVRAEGHALHRGVDLAAGLEHHFERSELDLRVEYFFHGTRELWVPDDTNYFLGRHNVAIGVSDPLTPLLTADLLLILSLDDPSALLVAYAVYSLLDDVEAALSVQVPVGSADEGWLGRLPAAVSLEARMYF